MQRYDFDELTKHECDDGEWVKASEALAEIARLNQICSDKSSEIYKLRGEVLRLKKVLQEIADYDCTLVEELDWPICLAKDALENGE